MNTPENFDSDVMLDTDVLGVSGLSGRHVSLQLQSGEGLRTVEGSDILIALGRTPNTSGIGLEKAGIEVTEKGHIRVNDRLETTAAYVWAMGDCAGSPYFTHVSEDDFAIIHENLNGGRRSTRDRLVPSCVFIDPELARVGLNESQARERTSYIRLNPRMFARVGTARHGSASGDSFRVRFGELRCRLLTK
ncbi:MAG: FAD-dependent oxidoreductase [Terracidiphilus sp.]